MEAWTEFCRELEQAGACLDRPLTPTDDIDQAEGLRYLSRLLRLGLDLAVEFADPEHPELVPAQAKHFGDGGNTADCVYHHAIIDGRRRYRLHGTRGDAPLIEIGAYAGKIGLHASSRRVDSVTERDLIVDADGRIDVHIGPEPAGTANVLRTDETVSYLFVRQYAHDWDATAPATLTLEATDAGTSFGEPLTLDRATAGLRRAARFVSDAAAAWASVVDNTRSGPANTLTPVPVDMDMTLPSGHRYAFGHFDLTEDDALVIEFRPTDVPYWGLALNNYWMEVPDYGGTGSHLNNETASREPDGRVRVVVSTREPAVANWVDTRGHRVGVLVFRWFRTAEPVPAFDTRVVPIASLASG